MMTTITRRFKTHHLTLMARGSCGAKALLPPRAQPKSGFGFVPRDTEEFTLKTKSQFEYVPQDTKKFRFLDFD
jgi:hypothetical protein